MNLRQNTKYHLNVTDEEEYTFVIEDEYDDDYHIIFTAVTSKYDNWVGRTIDLHYNKEAVASYIRCRDWIVTEILPPVELPEELFTI